MPDGWVDRWPNGYCHLFFSRNTRKTRVMAQCGQSTFNFDAETRCLFRLVQGTPDTLISFIPTTGLMGSLTTRTYFLRSALIDYRCTRGGNYKSIRHWNIQPYHPLRSNIITSPKEQWFDRRATFGITRSPTSPMHSFPRWHNKTPKNAAVQATNLKCLCSTNSYT